MIRWRQRDNAVTLCAFDLLELDGEDLRHEPIEVGKTTLIAYGSLDRLVGMLRGDARERDRCSAR